MKSLNKLIIFIDKIVNLIVIILFIIALAFGSYAIYDAYQVYDSANIPSNIAKFKPTEKEQFSLDSLKDINEDICGWIRIDGTNIDYAIVQGKDNSEYLNTNYNKEYSVSGSIFLDYRNDNDFKDDYSVIYGHNMKSNQMFADIKKFIDKDYFDNHSTGKLYTSDGVYELNVFCYAKISAFSNVAYNLNIYNNNRNSDIIKFYNEKSTIKGNIEVKEKPIIMLSTCDVADVNARNVLVATLQKIEDSEIINENTDSTLIKDEEEKKKVPDKKIDDNNIIQKEHKKQIRFTKRQIVLFILFVMVIVLLIELIILKTKKRNQKKSMKRKKKIEKIENKICSEYSNLNLKKENIEHTNLDIKNKNRKKGKRYKKK